MLDAAGGEDGHGVARLDAVIHRNIIHHRGRSTLSLNEYFSYGSLAPMGWGDAISHYGRI